MKPHSFAVVDYGRKVTQTFTILSVAKELVDASVALPGFNVELESRNEFGRRIERLDVKWG